MQTADNIEKIEKKIIDKVKSTKQNWQEIAEIIIQVEKEERWREKPKTRSFTVWLKALAKEEEGVSEGTLWRAYRAGKKMVTIWNKKNPNNTDSFKEISQKMGDLSAVALDTLETIKSTKVEDSFYEAVESEYLEKKLNVTSLSKVARELGKVRRLGLKPIELYASLHRVDFREILGLEKGPQHLVTTLPEDAGVDAIIILPNAETSPVLVGILVKDYSRKVEPNLDYVLAATIKGKKPATMPTLSTFEIDCISGQYELVNKPEQLQAESGKKGKLALALLNRVLTNDKSVMEV